MKIQSERDRIERRIVETKLKDVTKERDELDSKFIEALNKENELDKELSKVKSENDQLFKSFNLAFAHKEQAEMRCEDYMAFIVQQDEKNKKLKQWEAVLIKKEKEVRAIRKRDNPYEFVDFSDKSTQISNPVKDKGMNTEELIVKYASRPSKA
jgi:hypothetical protein